jgi:hypothetical protein
MIDWQDPLSDRVSEASGDNIGKAKRSKSVLQDKMHLNERCRIPTNFFRQPIDKDIEGELLPRISLQDGLTYAADSLLKRQIRVNSRANKSGVRDWPNNALRPRLGSIGHRGGDAEIAVPALGQKQSLEASQQCHEQTCSPAMAQRIQPSDQVV